MRKNNRGEELPEKIGMQYNKPTKKNGQTLKEARREDGSRTPVAVVLCAWPGAHVVSFVATLW